MLEGEGSIPGWSGEFSSVICDPDFRTGCGFSPVCSAVLTPRLGKGPFTCIFKILIHIITGEDTCTYTVNVSSRVVVCTLSSAHWQQASKLSALRRFELIWKD